MQRRQETTRFKYDHNLKYRMNIPAIILCHPQMGENIGTTARAMLNFGLTDLRIVAPRDGWPNERAAATASGAFDIMPEPQLFDTLKDAISDLHFTLATTARRRDMVKPVYNPDKATSELFKRTSNKQNTGIVFGAERAGLSNDELSLCQAIMTFPTNENFASLNLAQSVLLAAYEWNKACGKTIITEDKNTPASLDELNIFLERLERDLEDRCFFRAPDLKPTMLINIRDIFTRSDITEQELRTLHGILSALRGNKTEK